MKTMITFVAVKQNLLKSALVVLFSASALLANARFTAQEDPAPSTVSTPINKVASFTASLNNNKIDLKWSTEKEVNLSHVLVIKSTDGKNFKDAALVFAYGNTTAKSDYSFADPVGKSKSASVYYKLVIVNDDGTIQYSETCTVRVGK